MILFRKIIGQQLSLGDQTPGDGMIVEIADLLLPAFIKNQDRIVFYKPGDTIPKRKKERGNAMAVSHKGAISFGMVHIPVGLYTAVQDSDLRSPPASPPLTFSIAGRKK